MERFRRAHICLHCLIHTHTHRNGNTSHWQSVLRSPPPSLPSSSAVSHRFYQLLLNCHCEFYFSIVFLSFFMRSMLRNTAYISSLICPIHRLVAFPNLFSSLNSLSRTSLNSSIADKLKAALESKRQTQVCNWMWMLAVHRTLCQENNEMENGELTRHLCQIKINMKTEQRREEDREQKSKTVIHRTSTEHSHQWTYSSATLCIRAVYYLVFHSCILIYSTCFTGFPFCFFPVCFFHGISFRVVVVVVERSGLLALYQFFCAV